MGLNYGGRRKLDLRVQLTYPISNQTEDRQAVLRIEDAASSMTVLEVEIPAAELLVMMSGGQARVEARAPRADHMHRIGKQMEFGSETWKRHGDGAVAEDDMPVRVEEWRKLGGWETADWRKSNNGNWHVTGRRWVEIETEGESA